MSVHNVQLSENVYLRLLAHAEKLRLTPDQVVERLLAGELPNFFVLDDEAEPHIPPAGSDEALSAVHRLTSLFADLAIPDLEAALADPLIAQANADIDEFCR